MKSRTAAIAVLLVLLSLPLALDAQTDPEAAIKAMAASFTAGDLDGLMDYWTDDAVMEVVHLGATYTGSEEVRGLFDMLIGLNYEMVIDEVLQVEGDAITTSTTLEWDETRPLGVSVMTTQEYVVQDGKIKSLRCSWSEESIVALEAARTAAEQAATVAEALPDSGMPVESRALLPASVLAVALGVLAMAGG